jgi:hypothetical protein
LNSISYDKGQSYGLITQSQVKFCLRYVRVRVVASHPGCQRAGLGSPSTKGPSRVKQGRELVDDDAVKRRWERQEALLGLARDTPDEKFARGGLGALAAEPTVRIAVLPGDPSAQPMPAEEPDKVVPRELTLPGGRRLPYAAFVRGTSSGYVGFTTIGGDERWTRFHAVCWHGGVDVFLGDEGGVRYDLGPGFGGRVFFLRNCVGWAWAAFELQRQVVERYAVLGPFRAIVGMADTAKAVVGRVGAGWAEPTSGLGAPVAVEPRVFLVEDLETWPNETGVEELALRFGARVDLAFGGSGGRHLDRDGPQAGRFNPPW